jgi:hypothetical protein
MRAKSDMPLVKPELDRAFWGRFGSKYPKSQKAIDGRSDTPTDALPRQDLEHSGVIKKKAHPPNIGPVDVPVTPMDHLRQLFSWSPQAHCDSRSHHEQHSYPDVISTPNHRVQFSEDIFSPIELENDKATPQKRSPHQFVEMGGFTSSSGSGSGSEFRVGEAKNRLPDGAASASKKRDSDRNSCSSGSKSSVHSDDVPSIISIGSNEKEHSKTRSKRRTSLVMEVSGLDAGQSSNMESSFQRNSSIQSTGSKDNAKNSQSRDVSAHSSTKSSPKRQSESSTSSTEGKGHHGMEKRSGKASKSKPSHKPIFSRPSIGDDGSSPYVNRWDTIDSPSPEMHLPPPEISHSRHHEVDIDFVLNQLEIFRDSEEKYLDSLDYLLHVSGFLKCQLK